MGYNQQSEISSRNITSDISEVYVFGDLLRIFNPQILKSANFPARALAWLEKIQATSYLQNLVYGTEFVAGIAIAILIGVGILLALILLAPVAINIALFHFIIDPTRTHLY